MDTKKLSCTRTCGLLLLLVLLAQAGRAIERKREFYIVNLNPPSVSVVDAAAMKIAAEIQLDSEPTYALIHPSNRYLYVLEDGIYRANGFLKAGQSKLAVIDLDSRTKLKTIPIAWNTRNLALSKDGKYLVCVSEGKGVSKKKLPEENGSVTIIDTAKNEIAATMSAGARPSGCLYERHVAAGGVQSRRATEEKGRQLHQANGDHLRARTGETAGRDRVRPRCGNLAFTGRQIPLRAR
jgi:DNA-binding beta-propeller fold protein YncE